MRQIAITILMLLTVGLFGQDKELSELPVATSVAGTELMYVVQSGADKSITPTVLFDDVNTLIGALDSRVTTNEGDIISLQAGVAGNYLLIVANSDTLAIHLDTLQAHNDRLLALEAGGGTGSVTSVGAGAGMDFTTITAIGDVILGLPTTLTSATINEVTTTSHAHAVTGIPAYGVSNQIPHMNTGGTDFDYDAGLTWDGSTLRAANSSSQLAIVDTDDSKEWVFNANVSGFNIIESGGIGSIVIQPGNDTAGLLTLGYNNVLVKTQLSTDVIGQYSLGTGVTIEGVLVKNNNVTIPTNNFLYLNAGNTAHIRDVSDDMTFTDGNTGTKTLAELAASGGTSPWTKTGTNLSPTTLGDDILLTYGGERISFSDGDSYIYEATDDELRFVLGSAVALNLTASLATFQGHVLPDISLNNDIGSASLFWDNAYVNRLYVDNTSTYLDISSGDMTFTDANSGTVSLAALVAGSFSYWDRTGTLLSPVNAGDYVRADRFYLHDTEYLGYMATNTLGVYTSDALQFLFAGTANWSYNDLWPAGTTKTLDLGDANYYWDDLFIDKIYVDDHIIIEDSTIRQVTHKGTNIIDFNWANNYGSMVLGAYRSYPADAGGWIQLDTGFMNIGYESFSGMNSYMSFTGSGLRILPNANHPKGLEYGVALTSLEMGDSSLVYKKYVDDMAGGNYHVEVMDFDYNDNGTELTFSLDADDVIWKFELFVSTAFDGTSNQIRIGNSAHSDVYYRNTSDPGLNSTGWKTLTISNDPDRISGAEDVELQYYDGVPNATAGEAHLYIFYTKH